MPAPHHIPLTCELDEAGQRKFDTLNDSMEEEEEEEEQYDGLRGLPPSYHIPRHEDDYGVYIDDEMESQRDGSIISRTAIYV